MLPASRSMLDVVFNHTAEGNETGPDLGLRGFDNALYYRLCRQDPRPLQELHRLRQHVEFGTSGSARS